MEEITILCPAVFDCVRNRSARSIVPRSRSDHAGADAEIFEGIRHGRSEGEQRL
jgi:hypothetical protein